MARRSNMLSTILTLAVGYEVVAFGWNWYQTSQGQSGGGAATLLPLDGLGYLIGYPGTSTPGLLTGGAAAGQNFGIQGSGW